jgi:hypothetical protein
MTVKRGDIVFANEFTRVDGEEGSAVYPAIVTDVADTESGYGQGHEIVSLTVFGPNGQTWGTELDKSSDDEFTVGTWHENEDGPGSVAKPEPVSVPVDGGSSDPVTLTQAPTSPPPSESSVPPEQAPNLAENPNTPSFQSAPTTVNAG